MKCIEAHLKTSLHNNLSYPGKAGAGAFKALLKSSSTSSSSGGGSQEGMSMMDVVAQAKAGAVKAVDLEDTLVMETKLKIIEILQVWVGQWGIYAKKINGN